MENCHFCNVMIMQILLCSSTVEVKQFQNKNIHGYEYNKFIEF